jgi:PAS domain S-box-containing protein
MQELVRISLENEMDLILAHKRTMKLCELAGLSLSAQTTFATAISEVLRNTIDGATSGVLVLSVKIEKRDLYIVATIKDNLAGHGEARPGLAYAKKLVSKFLITKNGKETSIDLFYHIAPAFRIDTQKLDDWRHVFRNEPPMSAYEELKRKNAQLQDLTEKVQQNEARYRTLTDSLPMIILALNEQGELVYSNEWLQKLTGATMEELNQSKWSGVVHPDDYPAFLPLLHADTLSGTAAVTAQIRLRHLNGEIYIWHQLSLTPLYNERNELQQWIGYIVDIHSQKVYEETLKNNRDLYEAQQELKKNQEILEQYIDRLNISNLELQQFAFIASHDLQEPVRKVLYYSDALMQRYHDSLEERATEYLISIQSASHRMRDLIRDLLSFSLVTNEQPQYQPVNLNTIATEVLHDMEMAILEKSAVIHVRTLPFVTGDSRMLRQLFENLISNSLKYAKTGTASHINISASVRDNQLELVFQDNGIGFDEKYAEKIFKLFTRLHTKSDFAGNGLGLAICRKIAERHNGSIRASSIEGEGALFYVVFPVSQIINN